MMQLEKQLGYHETLMNHDPLSREKPIASARVFGVICEHEAADGIVPNGLNPSFQKRFDAPILLTGPQGGLV